MEYDRLMELLNYGMPKDCLLCHNFEDFMRWLLTHIEVQELPVYGTSVLEASIRGIGHINTLRGVPIIVDDFVPKDCAIMVKDRKIVGVIKCIKDADDKTV